MIRLTLAHTCLLSCASCSSTYTHDDHDDNEKIDTSSYNVSKSVFGYIYDNNLTVTDNVRQCEENNVVQCNELDNDDCTTSDYDVVVVGRWALVDALCKSQDSHKCIYASKNYIYDTCDFDY